MRVFALLGVAALAAAVSDDDILAYVPEEVVLSTKMTEGELDAMSRGFGQDIFSMEEQLKIAYSVHEQALAEADPIVLQRFQAAAASQIDIFPHVKDLFTTPAELIKHLGTTASWLTYQGARMGMSLVVEGETWTADEFETRHERWECKEILFFFARGTLEKGNLGWYDHPVFGKSQGVALAELMLKRYGRERVMVQGVNYPASLFHNLHPERTTSRNTAILVMLLQQAYNECPDSRIVVGGYSQGGAVVNTALMALKPTYQHNIVAAITYGSSRAYQDKYRIRNFPERKTRVYANPNDAITKGTLYTTPPAHFQYFKYLDQTMDFLDERVAFHLGPAPPLHADGGVDPHYVDEDLDEDPEIRGGEAWRFVRPEGFGPTDRVTVTKTTIVTQTSTEVVVVTDISTYVRTTRVPKVTTKMRIKTRTVTQCTATKTFTAFITMA